jgi:predicted ATPase
MTETTRLESVRIRGFRSLADVELSDLSATSILIGSNGSGKSNFMRFFEMLSWMLRSARLGEFVERYGGADDQLYGGNGTTPRMEAELALRTEEGRNEYRFSLAHVHPDRFMFTEEAFRFSRQDWDTKAPWNYLGSGHREAAIVEAAQSPVSTDVNPVTARVIVHLLRNCAVYQFHDTSDSSNFKKRWDVEDNNTLRTHGGNLASVLHRLEHEDNRRFESICRHITRVLPVFDRFQIDESYGRVLLRWKAKGTDKTFGAHLTSDGSLHLILASNGLSASFGKTGAGSMRPYILSHDDGSDGLDRTDALVPALRGSSDAHCRSVCLRTLFPCVVSVGLRPRARARRIDHALATIRPAMARPSVLCAPGAQVAVHVEVIASR